MSGHTLPILLPPLTFLKKPIDYLDMADLIQMNQAIDAALRQDWKEAIKLNSSIIKNDQTNIDAFNRLAFAYLKNGQMKKSKETFEKTLKIDPYNQIACKNLKKIHIVKKCSLFASENQNISPLLFLEEPGKTKIIPCINAAQVHTLSALSCGQKVVLKPKKYTIEVRDKQNRYIAALPDDIAFRLLKLIACGNQYSVFVKGVSKNCVSVFIRETKRGKKLHNQPSFIGTTNYIPYQKGILHEESKPHIPSDDEEEEDQSPKEEER